MTVKVEFKFLGVFRRFSRRNRIPVKLEKPANVGKAIQKLTEAFSSEFGRMLIDPELQDPRPNAIILVNGKEISVLRGLETEVEDGDEIVLVPVAHGG